MKKRYTTPVCEKLNITENRAVLFNISLGATEPFGKEDDFENEDFDQSFFWEDEDTDIWIRRKSILEEE